MKTIEYESTLTCPECGNRTIQIMPDDAWQLIFQCPACRRQIRAQPGDCCVFCSYGSVHCPSKQREAIEAESQRSQERSS